MKTRQYGILNPKKLDYLLAIISIMLAACSLWISIWITVTETVEIAKPFYIDLYNALIFNLNVENYLIVALESVIMYCGFIFAFLTLLAVIFKKRAWALQGIVAILIGTAALVLNVEFIATYANVALVGVHGVFVVLLAVATVFIAMLMLKTAKIVCRLVGKKEEYIKYVYDAPIVAEKEEPKKEASEDDDDYIMVNIAEQMNGYWENSNGYKNQEPKEVEPAPKAEPKPEPKPEPKVEPKVEPKPVSKPEKKEIKKAETGKSVEIKSNNYTFEQKLKMAKPQTREYFKEIKKAFEELGFKAAMTKYAETFVYKNTKYAMITTAGLNGLRVYYKLDAKKYANSTIPVKDVSEKRKYEKTPTLFVVKSDLAVRRAKALMEDIKKKLDKDDK